ncbi:unnamed protein product [Leuciscus chuanchicus]
MCHITRKKSSTIPGGMNTISFQKIDRNQFPKHVDGSAIRTLSNVKFGRPELAGCFYSTTSQEQFPPKEVDHPKPTIYPPSNMLREQEPERMLSTSHTDFVPLNSRRQELSPSHLQRVAELEAQSRVSASSETGNEELTQSVAEMEALIKAKDEEIKTLRGKKPDFSELEKEKEEASQRMQTGPQHRFNVALSKISVKIEMTFGILKARFNCVRRFRVTRADHPAGADVDAITIQYYT